VFARVCVRACAHTCVCVWRVNATAHVCVAHELAATHRKGLQERRMRGVAGAAVMKQHPHATRGSQPPNSSVQQPQSAA